MDRQVYRQCSFQVGGGVMEVLYAKAIQTFASSLFHIDDSIFVRVEISEFLY